MKNILVFGFTILASYTSCEQSDDSPDITDQSNVSKDWLIPQNQVKDGGPGKDGIPALDNPEFVTVESIEYISDQDLVLGYKNGEDVRAYPHAILDWHEIINDQIGDDMVAVTYCPLTGTGIGWNRKLQNGVTTFGVSGLLYNSNLIPYDRLTDSNWSQMRLDCVNGKLQSTKVDTYPLVETTWKTWKEMYPGSIVVSDNTGYSRPYDRYPYGDYRTNHEFIIFRVYPEDKRLQAKTRVLGVLHSEKVKAYRFDEFIFETKIINDVIENDNIVIVGNKDKNFIVAFFRYTEDETLLDFEPIQDKGAIILRDNEGNEWNVFGEAVSGPRIGQKLQRPVAFMSYWFALGAFYPLAEIYDD